MGKFVIKEDYRFELVVEKSRFIAYLRPISSEQEFLEFKSYVYQTSPQATHYPYAYVLEKSARSSDDGEPSGTAGRPLLELLSQWNLTNVCAFVVRYYGGVKLGAGRLLRTYVETLNQAFMKIDHYELIPSQLFTLTIKANELGTIEYNFLKLGIEIQSSSYLGEIVVLKINCPNEVDLNKFNLQVEKISDTYIYRKEEKYGKQSSKRTSK